MAAASVVLVWPLLLAHSHGHWVGQLWPIVGVCGAILYTGWKDRVGVYILPSKELLTGTRHVEPVAKVDHENRRRITERLKCRRGSESASVRSGALTSAPELAPSRHNFGPSIWTGSLEKERERERKLVFASSIILCI